MTAPMFFFGQSDDTRNELNNPKSPHQNRQVQYGGSQKTPTALTRAFLWTLAATLAVSAPLPHFRTVPVQNLSSKRSVSWSKPLAHAEADFWGSVLNGIGGGLGTAAAGLALIAVTDELSKLIRKLVESLDPSVERRRLYETYLDTRRTLESTVIPTINQLEKEIDEATAALELLSNPKAKFTGEPSPSPLEGSEKFDYLGLVKRLAVARQKIQLENESFAEFSVPLARKPGAQSPAQQQEALQTLIASVNSGKPGDLCSSLQESLSRLTESEYQLQKLRIVILRSRKAIIESHRDQIKESREALDKADEKSKPEFQFQLLVETARDEWKEAMENLHDRAKSEKVFELPFNDPRLAPFKEQMSAIQAVYREKIAMAFATHDALLKSYKPLFFDEKLAQMERDNLIQSLAKMTDQVSQTPQRVSALQARKEKVSSACRMLNPAS